jgi:hypothetical protein
MKTKKETVTLSLASNNTGNPKQKSLWIIKSLSPWSVFYKNSLYQMWHPSHPQKWYLKLKTLNCELLNKGSSTQHWFSLGESYANYYCKLLEKYIGKDITEDELNWFSN